MAASNTFAAWLHQADEAPPSSSAPASGTHNFVEVGAIATLATLATSSPIGDDTTSAMAASLQSIARSQERQTELLGRQTALLEALVVKPAAAKPAAAKPAAAPVQQTQAMQTEDMLSKTPPPPITLRSARRRASTMLPWTWKLDVEAAAAAVA